MFIEAPVSSAIQPTMTKFQPGSINISPLRGDAPPPLRSYIRSLPALTIGFLTRKLALNPPAGSTPNERQAKNSGARPCAVVNYGGHSQTILIAGLRHDRTETLNRFADNCGRPNPLSPIFFRQ